MTSGTTDMPYNVDMNILEKILSELKHTKEDGMNVNQMWTNIGEAKNVGKSYTLNMVKVLNLVEIEGDTIRLTNTGRLAMLAPENKRREVLAANLPAKYMAMYKWIKIAPHQQMQSGDMKTEYFKNYGDIHSPKLLERIVASFAKYLEYLGLAKYVGKGQGSKITLTEFGNKFLSQPIHQETLGKPEITDSLLTDEKSPLENDKNVTEHPIKISSPGRLPFTHDIRSESDWKVIDSFVESIKEDWKKKTNPRKSQTGK